MIDEICLLCKHDNIDHIRGVCIAFPQNEPSCDCRGEKSKLVKCRYCDFQVNMVKEGEMCWVCKEKNIEKEETEQMELFDEIELFDERA